MALTNPSDDPVKVTATSRPKPNFNLKRMNIVKAGGTNMAPEGVHHNFTPVPFFLLVMPYSSVVVAIGGRGEEGQADRSDEKEKRVGSLVWGKEAVN
jgi:hypothetical protein